MKVMKNFVISLSVLLLAGCSGNVEKTATGYNLAGLLGNRNIDVVIIDGCEYLYGDWGHATVLTHKGNCKNHKN